MHLDKNKQKDKVDQYKTESINADKIPGQLDTTYTYTTYQFIKAPGVENHVTTYCVSNKTFSCNYYFTHKSVRQILFEKVTLNI